MVQNKSSRKSKNKQSSKKSRKTKKRSKSNQRGGNNKLSTSCGLSKTGLASNIHNTNPQASLDLDNKFISYGGPVPLGSSIVGGGSCGSQGVGPNIPKIVGGGSCGTQGVGTSNPKSETFKEYISNLNSKLDYVAKGGSEHTKIKIPSPNSEPQSVSYGGGYSLDASEFIGGQPAIRAYDDISPPAIIGGKLVFGSPDQPVCGNGAVGGGSRKKNRKSKKNSKTAKTKSRKSKKTKQKGGGDFRTFHKSNPADYQTAFSGEPGVFAYPDNMMAHTFDGKQPVWNPSEI